MKGFSKTRTPNLRRNDASGIFYAATRIGKGKHEVWRTLGTDKESIAKIRLPKKLAQIRADAGRLRGWNLTLGECAAVFMERKRAQGRRGKLLKPRSLEYREETIEMLRRLWTGFDAVPAGTVSKAECESLANRARQRYSGTRFNGMMQSLRGILEVAVESGALERNPAQKIESARVNVGQRFVPTREQFTDILQRLDAKPSRRFSRLSIRALAFTGIRPEEGRWLTPYDIDLNEGTAEVRETKNGSPRTIYLIPQALELFREERIQAVLAALKKDARRTLGTISRELRLDSFCCEHKLKPLSPYSFRKLYQTRLRECGVDVEFIAELVGHRDRGVTALRSYIQTRPAHARRKLEGVIV